MDSLEMSQLATTVSNTCDKGCCSSNRPTPGVEVDASRFPVPSEVVNPPSHHSSIHTCEDDCCVSDDASDANAVEPEPIKEPRDDCACCSHDDAPEREDNISCKETCCVPAQEKQTCSDSCCSQDNETIDEERQSTGRPAADTLKGDCCASQNETESVACRCCVLDIVRSAFAVQENAVANSLTRYTNTLRRCCAILEKCCRKSCCFTQPTQEIHRTITFQPSRVCDAPSTESLHTLGGRLRGKEEQADSKTSAAILKLALGGMDCADCMSKVGRALNRLPTVKDVETDYFNGSAQLRYHPEFISPPAIISYLRRATGFDVSELNPTDLDASTSLTLPFFFEKPPSPSLIDRYEMQRGRSKNTWNVIIRSAPDSSRSPRQVANEVQEHGGRLADDPSPLGDNRSLQDLRNLVARTTLCALFTIPVLVLVWADLPPNPVSYGAVSVALSSIVQVLAFPMYSASIRSILFLRRVDTNVLASVSTLVSYAFSVVAFAFEVKRRPFSTPFFETATLLVTLIYLGRTVQAATRYSAGSAIRALHHLQGKEVTVLEDGGASRVIDARLLQYGDIIEVLPDTRIVTDGLIISGSGDVDESSVTGESAAVAKFSGSRVLAGTINLNGILHVQVIRLVHENSLTRISQLVRHAQSARVLLQDIADRLSGVVLPVAATVAALALLIWTLVGVFVRHQSRVDSAIDGLMKSIAVLAVSCPCAIGLAVPLVTAISMRILVRSGVVVRSPDLFDALRRVTVVVFDKTGTLSQGVFTVMESHVFVEGSEHLVYALLKGNQHPIAQGVTRFLESRISQKEIGEGIDLPNREIIPGKGVRAVMEGYELLGGNAVFTGSSNEAIIKQYIASGQSIFVVTLGGVSLAAFGLSDLPRPESHLLVKTLHDLGKKVMVLSGDNSMAVSRFAEKVGIPEESTQASCTPEGKQAVIRSLQSKHETILFVGDGTNDGPALATANASLAIASGSEVAHTSAGGILLNDNIHRDVLLLLNIAHASALRIKLALAWSALYMVLAVILASGAAVNFSIEPRWAGLGEVVSVIPVILIGFTLRQPRQKP